jgi:hypothetical protein
MEKRLQTAANNAAQKQLHLDTMQQAIDKLKRQVHAYCCRTQHHRIRLQERPNPVPDTYSD